VSSKNLDVDLDVEEFVPMVPPISILLTPLKSVLEGDIEGVEG
jgi:hypothetical protein